MNTLEGMIKDLNKSELVADDGETDICTTSGELITALKRLQHYEDLEEQGRLIDLPCKVGDTVWVLNGKFILEYEIDSFAVDEGGAWLMYLRHYEKMRTFCHNKEANELGKTVFLTKEEAEAALKGAEQ